MKKIAALIIVTAILTGWYARSAVSSAGEIDVMCRNKAKEAATEAYRGCVTENKTAQIEEIRKEYKDQLKALKDKYDAELKNVAGANSAAANADQAPAAASSGATSSPKKAKAAVAKTKKITKKQQKHVEMDFTQESTEQAPEARSSGPDDSKMDIPEPIPVEDPTSN